MTEDGRDVYFHHHAVEGHAFDELQEGDTVQVEIQQLADQHAHAIKLVRLHKHA